MLKKIKNVYDYTDYRLLLRDDFMVRTSGNHNYSLRAFSRDLSLSPGFLSDILRGNKELSLVKSREVFCRLGFDLEEMEYIEKLVVLKSVRDEAQRQEALKYIQARYNRVGYKGDSSKDLLIKSLQHFIVYGIARRLPRLEEIFRITDQLEIGRENALEILEEFKAEGYVVESDGNYSVADDKLTIRDHARLAAIIQEYSNLLFKLVEKQGGPKPPESVVHSLILGLNEQSYGIALEAHKHFIKSLHRISKESTQVDRFLLVADVLMTVK